MMAARRADLEGLPYWPRLLSREQAAAYLGVTGPTLDGFAIVSQKVGNRRLYDRQILDRWADGLSHVDGSDNIDDVLKALD